MKDNVEQVNLTEQANTGIAPSSEGDIERSTTEQVDAQEEKKSKNGFANKLYEFFFSKFFRQASYTRKLAYLGVFAALAIVANVFSVDFGFGNSNKLSFLGTVAFLTGCVFGGAGGFIIMAVADALGVVIKGDTFNVIISIGTSIMGLIPGLIMTNVKSKTRAGFVVKAIISFALTYVVCTVFINSYGNYVYVVEFIWSGNAKKTFWVYTAGRLAAQSAVSGINIALSLSLAYALSGISYLGLDIASIRSPKQNCEAAKAD